MNDTPKPIIFSVDDDPQVLSALKRDLRTNYKKDYRIISTAHAKEGLAALQELKKKGEEVALFISDQRMPEMLGVDFLEQAKPFFPAAKRVLLTAYSDTDAAIKAINDVQLDYYFLKPWDPPTERLYPILNELLDEWQAGFRPAFRGIRIIGYPYSPKSHELKDFLAGNLLPYQWMDAERSKEAQQLLSNLQLTASDLPVVIFEDGIALTDPSVQTLAAKIGLQPTAQSDLYDLAIIGAGPAGLAAAVYGGSEGLKTLLIERRAPGGQAGTSSRIENYLGFPKGLSGSELARRAVAQATRFKVELLAPQEVSSIALEGQYKKVKLADGSEINARALIITTGVAYRKLPAEGADELSGAGVYYGAATTEASTCREKEIYLVGGGNSAGQGAVYLSQFAKTVHILVRRDDLRSTMSSYLVDQIEAIPNIQVHGRQQVLKAMGKDQLQSLLIERMQDKSTFEVKADALFVFIGARPYTDWLGDLLLRNDKGFLKTGNELAQDAAFAKTWKHSRMPFLLESSVPGIFAAGDVRAGAMNRVAAAVGEGAMAVKFVHEYLAEV